MSNLALSLFRSSSVRELSDRAIGAYEATLAPCTRACSRLCKFIACTCWSDLAWSKTLVVRTELAPVIHLSLKFFPPIILSLYLAQARHFSSVTTFTPASVSVAQSSHVTVWHLRSYLDTHFVYVSCFTFRRFAPRSLSDTAQALARRLFMIAWHDTSTRVASSPGN